MNVKNIFFMMMVLLGVVFSSSLHGAKQILEFTKQEKPSEKKLEEIAKTQKPLHLVLWKLSVVPKIEARILQRVILLEIVDMPFVDNKITSFLHACPQLKKISVLGSSCLSINEVKSINLEKVDCAFSYISDEGVSRLCAGCPKLRELDLSHSKILIRPDIRGAALEKICLTETSVTDEVVEALCSNCPLLKFLELSFCDNLETPKIRGQKIEMIDLMGTEVTDEAITEIFKNCPALKRVNISHCEQLGGQCIVDLTTRYPNCEILQNSVEVRPVCTIL